MWTPVMMVDDPCPCSQISEIIFMGTAGCSSQVGGVLDTQRGCEEANPSPGEMPGCTCCCVASRVLCTSPVTAAIIAEPPLYCPTLCCCF